jgi:hypothetical protein
MKTNGATWKAYINSWPDGQWYDDSDELFNDTDPEKFDKGEPPDDAVVSFSYGVVYAGPNDHEGTSLTKHFRAWLKAQTHATVVCSIPKGSLEAFTAFVKSIKGSVAA